MSSFANIVMLFTEKIIENIFFGGNFIEKEISTMLQLFASILGIVLIIIFCIFIEKRTIASMGIIKKHICKQCLKGIFVGSLLISFIVFLGVCFNVFVLSKINSAVNNNMILVLFFFGFMLQGFYEELIFRSYFMLSISRRHNILMAVIANSILFSIVHISNNGFQAIAFFNLVLFGIFESIYLLKTGSIFGTSAIHGMWNFMQGNFYGFNVSGIKQYESLLTFKTGNFEIFTGGNFGLEGSLLSTIILMIGIAIIIMLSKAKKQ